MRNEKWKCINDKMRLSILNVVEVVKSCSNQVAQPHFFILRTQCAHLHFSFLIPHFSFRNSGIPV